MDDATRFSREIKSNYAFLAKSIFDLHCLIQSQSEELYLEKELGFPVWSSSTLLLLSRVKSASIMEISKGLNLSHQLTSQRIKMLLKLELIQGVPDANDKRRTIYHLTSKGKDKSKILELYCLDAAHAFKDLSDEIGFDIQLVMNSAIAALSKKTFSERFPDNLIPYEKRITKGKKDEK
ncbi:MAG: winged helix DNA-binding protein [Alteromonadaceae bacterium]|nr:winged helix DNA-binding protein [Alteromonadaceae bacterium]